MIKGLQALESEAPALAPGPRTLDFESLATCVNLVIHEEAVALARNSMVDPESAWRIAELFKVFADPTRIRLLSALAASELCVCDLGAALGMSQSATSHQLALLRSARLVRSRREGKVVFYSLDDDHVRLLLDLGAGHSREGKV